MNNLIRKALEKDLYSRYKNGAEFAKDLSAVRYKIVDDKYVPPDTSRFSILRKQTFFTEFDDLDIWEVLRMSAWRRIEANVTVVREGDADQRFGMVIEGKVEASVGGRKVADLGEGEVFGELAYLDSLEHKHMMTIVSLEPTTYIEFNPAALALATEECLAVLRKALTTLVARRLGSASRQLSASGEVATKGSAMASGFEMQLVDD